METPKIIETKTAINKCPDCKKVTYNNTYVLLPEAMSVKDLAEMKTIRLAFCPCGNIFLRQRLYNEGKI